MDHSPIFFTSELPAFLLQFFGPKPGTAIANVLLLVPQFVFYDFIHLLMGFLLATSSIKVLI